MEDLDDNEKQLLAFSLFSTTKKLPVSSTPAIMKIAKKLEVTLQYAELVANQVDYPKSISPE